MPAVKDRWHQLLAAIQDSNMSAADTAVFRYLLDKANYETTELPAKFTPTRQVIARKTRVSLRQVHYSVQHLRRHGWLAVSGTTGRGHRPEYKITAGVACDCARRVHTAARKQERVQPSESKGAAT